MSPNKSVLDKYALYLWFMGTRKNADANPVLLDTKQNNATRLHAMAGVVNPASSTIGTFLVEQSVKNRGNFGFKIRVPVFGEEPCFRFDADGPAHRNHLPTIPAPQQQVTTPHFHCYNPDGVLIAYKTPELLDASAVAKLRADICFGLSLFCKQAILYGTGTNELTCAERVTQLPGLALPVEPDPLAGVTFGI